jgi:hypothetical protein
MDGIHFFWNCINKEGEAEGDYIFFAFAFTLTHTLNNKLVKRFSFLYEGHVSKDISPRGHFSRDKKFENISSRDQVKNIFSRTFLTATVDFHSNIIIILVCAGNTQTD